jgi:hypothetical protein
MVMGDAGLGVSNHYITHLKAFFSEFIFTTLRREDSMAGGVQQVFFGRPSSSNRQSTVKRKKKVRQTCFPSFWSLKSLRRQIN